MSTTGPSPQAQFRMYVAAGAGLGLVFLALLTLANLGRGQPNVTEAVNPQPDMPSLQIAAETEETLPVEFSNAKPSSPDGEESPEFVIVANTQGAGAYVRVRPESTSRGIAAWRENTRFLVMGPDRLVDGRRWRNVQDPRGNRGWTPAEYLVPDESARAPASR